MEPGEILKREAFDNLVTIFIPGALMILPYNFILVNYYPLIAEFWKNFNVAYVSIYVFFSMFTGLILDGLGVRLEIVWDWLLDKDKERKHMCKWNCYLKQTLTHDLIAQRYLSGKVIGMKFELNIAASLMFVNGGIIWLYNVAPFCTFSSIVKIISSLVLLNIYIIWESYRSALLLSNTRSLILETVQNNDSETS